MDGLFRGANKQKKTSSKKKRQKTGKNIKKQETSSNEIYVYPPLGLFIESNFHFIKSNFLGKNF